MEIIKSSTTEFSFLLKSSDPSIFEKDFILITNKNITPNTMHLAQIEKLTQTKDGEINGLAIILGEINLNDFSLSPCQFPLSSDSTINQPPQGWISKIMSYRGDNGIYLGDIMTSRNNSDPFLISPDFLERHVLCVASTGAGKSYSIGVLLEEIILKFKSAAVLLFDIHNEYWGLAFPNDGKEIEKLNYQNYKPQGFHNKLLVFEKESLGLGTYFDLPKLRRVLNLTSAQENSLLNILRQSYQLNDLITKIQESNIHTATRENLILKINSLINMKLFDKELNFRKLIHPEQISIIRLDQFVDERKRKLLVNEILNQLFNKKLSGEIAHEHEIVIIVEEAHRFAAESEILSKIAREGRKFGLYEILISQRPGDLPDNIIANINTLISLRIRSDKDINKIRLMEGISTNTVSILPHLSRGEALIVGLQKSINRPIKIRIRPRLSKHIDPQEDQIPNNIPRYKISMVTNKILEDKETNIYNFELNNININWFLQLIPEITISTLSDSLKKEILERDLIFESKIRLKPASIIKINYNEYNLNLWAKFMAKKGFKVDYKTPNPICGVKLLLSTETQKVICSIAKLSNKEFFIIIGEVS